MSLVSIKSPKHCAKQGTLNIDKLHKKIFCIISASFSFLLFILFLVFVILHPSKPQFSLLQADLYQLNFSASPHLLNSSIELTLFATNPNQKVGIYYDELQVYVSYKSQQITAYSSLPPFYQGFKDTNLLTASVVGSRLPVASSLGYEAGLDRTNGKLVFNVKVNGRLRWKVGSWVSGGHRVNIDCVAVIAATPFTVQTGVPLSSKQAAQCSTAV